MLNISIQIIFSTGRLLGSDCSGAYLLEPPNIGAIDLDCASHSVAAESNPWVPTGGGISVRVGKHLYEGCVVPYVSGHDATGPFISVYCPDQKK